MPSICISIGEILADSALWEVGFGRFSRSALVSPMVVYADQPCGCLHSFPIPEAAQLPEDAIAGRAGIFCAVALCAGVRGLWRVSLTSGERSGQEDEESLLRGKLEWKSASAPCAALAGTKLSERSFSGVKRA